MKASEIPVGHLFYNTQLNKYGIVCFPHDDCDVECNVIIWLHNFCAAPVNVIDEYPSRDKYIDLGPAPKFNITHKEIKETVVKVEVVNT